jgi:predicted acetyltransferase
MSIEIDILNGDASWPMARSLHEAVWGPEKVAGKPWAHVKWANADLRVLIEAPDDGLVCHVGIYFRTVKWNGQKVHIGGLGGVCTREDRRGRGYATMAIDAALHTIRANEAARFALLFCEPHNVAFYEARRWQAFKGEVYCEQPEGRTRFTEMAPYVFDIVRAPTLGTIDLCGLPW